MITLADITRVEIPADHFAIVKGYAKAVEFGGRSSVYSNREERMGLLEENQLTGQAGEYGGCVALYDYEKYLEKQTQEIAKGQGDDGTDIIGVSIPIDIKTSNVKVGPDEWGKVLYARHLMVSEHEYSPNMIYIGAVVLQAPKHTDETATVYVMGWTWGRDLKYMEWREKPNAKFPNGRERSGFRLKYGALKPLSKMNWKGLLLPVAQIA